MDGHSKTLGATPIPAQAGVGLKPEHYWSILVEPPRVGWFEIHAENFMEAGGPPHHYLTRIRELYPLSVHGVGLSIGGADALDRGHLRKLKAVCDRYQPGLVSEHLAWSTHDGVFLNDLLPVPYNAATLDVVCAHIDQVQETLRRRLLLENPSTYVQFADSDRSELDFLREVTQRTGCGLLLDVNNVHVSATNHGFDAGEYLESFPLARVGEIHLAGHAIDTDGTGAPLLIDAHGTAIDPEVWRLFASVIARTGPLPTLIEWDNDIPTWSRLSEEARRADTIMAGASNGHVSPAA